MIRRREDYQETKTGHERWLVSYADFITLLFGFFVVMYSVSQVSEQKYRTLTDTLANVFDSQVPRGEQRFKDVVGESPANDLSIVSGLSSLEPSPPTDAQMLMGRLESSLAQFADQQNITVSATEQWVEIDVNANLLFDSASAEPRAEAQRIFYQVAETLAPFDNEIQVAGHTDNRPIRTQEFSNNWELSAARAVSVVGLLADRGIASNRLSAMGFGEFRPVADNETPEGRARNRRVVLKVALHQTAPAAGPPMRSNAAVPTQILADPEPAADPAGVEPVRLDHGGLLFRHDPESSENRD